MKLSPWLASLLLLVPAGVAAADPYLVDRYDSLHDTPAQRWFRELALTPPQFLYQCS